MICLFLAAMSLPAVAVAAPAQPSPAGPYQGTRTIEHPEYEPGEMLVKAGPGLTRRSLGRMRGAAGVAREMGKLSGVSGGEVHRYKLHDYVRVEDAVRYFEARDGIEYAEPNYRFQPAEWRPTDPGFSEEYGLENTGQVIEGQAGTPDADMDMPEAWEIEKGDTSPQTVAVLDTGIDRTHPDLATRVWTNPDEVAANGVDDDGNGKLDDTWGWNTAGIAQKNYYYDEGGGSYQAMYRELGKGGTGAYWHPAGTGDPDNDFFYGVHALDESHIWAVGANGKIRFCDGGNWTAQASGTAQLLADVWAADPWNVWAVGDNGTILHFNGTSWSAQASGTTAHLNGVSGLDSTHVWAVGENGTVRYFNGTSWSGQSAPTSRNLNGVSALDSTHVWAAGDYGTALFYGGSGTGWVQQDGNHSEYSLAGVSALDSTHVWAVGGTTGNEEKIRFFNGTAWQDQVPAGHMGPLRGVSALDGSHVWAVGDDGETCGFDGSTWEWFGFGAGNQMKDVSVLHQNLAWGVGSSGLAIRYFEAGSQVWGQSVTATGTTTSRIGVMLGKNGDPTGPVTVSLRTGSIAGPSVGSYTLSPAEVPDIEGSVVMDLDTACWVAEGVQFFIVISTTNSSDTDYYYLYENDDAHTYTVYPGGSEQYWDGAVWTQIPEDDFYFFTNEDEAPVDDNGHGTHVSGIVAAEAQGTGVVGVAPGAKVMPLKVFGSYGGCTHYDIATALQYASGEGARIANMSIGGGAQDSDQMETLQDIINSIHDKADDPMILFASAGNDSSAALNYPAAFNKVVGVGATDNNDARAAFSNYNSSVDVTAPGWNVYSAMPTYEVTYNSPPPGPGYAQDYDHMSGTSMACPHAAGLAALVLSRNPELKPDDVERLIEERSDDRGAAGRDDYYGFGRINAMNALSGPRVTSVSPASAKRGETRTLSITCSGTHFQEYWPDVSLGDGVSIGQVSVIAGDNTHMFAQVQIASDAPLGARSVIVSNRGEYIDPLLDGFTVLDNNPQITGIEPDSGVVGETVTVTGSNLGSSRGSSKVTFDGVEATQYVSWSDTQVKVKVPSGATSGPVKVTTGAGTSNGVAFTVQAPTVSSIDPPTSKPGESVTINGDNFGTSGAGASGGAASYVSFNGVCATEYDSWTNTRIVATVPEGATSGPVTVVTGSGTSNSDKTLSLYYPTWYLAEGTTAWGFDTYISIENPNDTGVEARVIYMTATGAVSGGTVVLPALSQATVDPADTLGEADFSTKVECLTDGKSIAVDRTMTWTGEGADSPEAHTSVGVTAPAETWYLPEGSSAWGFETWLLIQNPNTEAVTATVTYMIEGADPVSVEKSVPAASRASFSMEDDIGEHDASIEVVADDPVIPERAMYKDDRREGHDSIGTTRAASTYYLAEGTTAWGFTTYVLVQNPNSAEATVTLTYMTDEGPEEQAPFTMPANSRRTVRVNDALPDKDFSTKVEADRGVIAERAMYWESD
ncbi:MAG: S8 family serine peptidase, partial [Actinomycetota bacterium]